MKDAIESIIQQYIKNYTGDFSAGWIDLKTNESFYYHPDLEMPTASVYKIFILAELLRKTYEENLSWDDEIPLSSNQLSPGSGLLQHLHSGLALTLRDYAILMMIISDNTAADILFHFCTAQSIQRYILEKYDLHHTRCMTTCCEMVNGYYGHSSNHRNDSDALKIIENNLSKNPSALCGNVTTARDISDFLSKIYEGHVTSPQSCQEMLHIMKLCQTNTRIPYFIPSFIQIAHKTGTMDRLANDAGIIYAPKGDYILSLFYNGNSASRQEYLSNINGHQSEQLLAHISRDIYALYK